MAQSDNVSFRMTDQDMAEVQAAIATLKSKLLPQLKTISPAERQELPKMGDKTVAFVTKTLEYCGSNADLVPPFLDVGAFTVDVNAVESLRSVYQPIAQIADALNDTMLLSGSEAYTGALIYYQAVRSATKNNISGAKTIYEDLSNRFPTRPGKTPDASGTSEVKAS